MDIDGSQPRMARFVEMSTDASCSYRVCISQDQILDACLQSRDECDLGGFRQRGESMMMRGGMRNNGKSMHILHAPHDLGISSPHQQCPPHLAVRARPRDRTIAPRAHRDSAGRHIGHTLPWQFPQAIKAMEHHDGCQSMKSGKSAEKGYVATSGEAAITPGKGSKAREGGDPENALAESGKCRV